jgi:hypothetical protein
VIVGTPVTGAEATDGPVDEDEGPLVVVVLVGAVVDGAGVVVVDAGLVVVVVGAGLVVVVGAGLVVVVVGCVVGAVEASMDWGGAAATSALNVHVHVSPGCAVTSTAPVVPDCVVELGAVHDTAPAA